MFLGVIQLRLYIPHARSLKDRRAVLRRAVDRVRARLPVSIAEVGDTSRWQVATLAASVVSSDAAVARDVLDKVASVVESACAGDALVTERDAQVEARDEMGPGVQSGVEEKFHGDDEGD